ncbi:MAG: DUF6265 family protein [Planctomycetota bacterium]
MQRLAPSALAQPRDGRGEKCGLAVFRVCALFPLVFVAPREDPPQAARPVPFDGGFTCVLHVKNVQAAVGWYREALGFELRHAWPEFGFAELATPGGDARLGLLLRDPPKAGAGGVPSFGVRDIEESERRLRARNVRLLSVISEIPNFLKLITFADPDGNVLQLYQPLLPPSTAAADVPELAFLTGSWRSVEGWTVREVHWTAGGGGSMLGVARTVENGRETSFDFLRIERTDDGLVYELSPLGAAAIPFALKEHASARAMFESKEDGFPKRVTYWIDEDGRLRMLLEGTRDGSPLRSEYAWARSGFTSR